MNPSNRWRQVGMREVYWTFVHPKEEPPSEEQQPLLIVHEKKKAPSSEDVDGTPSKQHEEEAESDQESKQISPPSSSPLSASATSALEDLFPSNESTTSNESDVASIDWDVDVPID